MARFLQNSLTTAELFAATPSSLHGIARELETDLRIHGTNQIAAVGILLRLPQTAIATAQTIFHRFYCLVSFKDHRIRDVVLGSVFLASKVEECPRKIRDIIDVYDKLLHPTHVGCDDRAFDAYKECMIQAELQILCRLGFDVQVQHPHGYMINYLQSLGLAEDRVLLQTAWNYLNDSTRTIVCVCWQPSCIASAAIFLAARKCGIKLPTSPPWWELFDCGLQDLEAISSHILSLYDRKSLSSAVVNTIRGLFYLDIMTKVKIDDMTAPIPAMVYWDVENVGVPGGMRGEDVVRRLVDLLAESRLTGRPFDRIKSLVLNADHGVRQSTHRNNPGPLSNNGTGSAQAPRSLREIVAVCSMNHVSDILRRSLQECGVVMMDCASGKQNAADMALMAEILKLTLHNRPPFRIYLISSDKDFAKTLNILADFGYEVTLIHGPQVSGTLLSAATEAYEWADVMGLPAHSYGPVTGWNHSPPPPPPSVISSLQADQQSAFATIHSYVHQRPHPSPSQARTPDPSPPRDVPGGGCANGLASRKSLSSLDASPPRGGVNGGASARKSPINGSRRKSIAGTDVTTKGVGKSTEVTPAKKSITGLEAPPKRSPAGPRPPPQSLMALSSSPTIPPTLIPSSVLLSSSSAPGESPPMRPASPQPSQFALLLDTLGSLDEGGSVGGVAMAKLKEMVGDTIVDDLGFPSVEACVNDAYAAGLVDFVMSGAGVRVVIK